MRRNFDDLRRGPFDLLVVGGGVYGAWTAYDAALRGLRVALVERRDWAQATSSASSKLIHGGLRYLEYGHVGLVRRSLDERSRLQRLGPHRVQPMRFVFPVYEDGPIGLWRLRIGLWIYDRLAGRRRVVGPHEVLDRNELLSGYGLQARGLRGGLRFGDARTDDARFVLEIVDGAIHAGAVAVNHAAVEGLLAEGDRVAGASIVDGESGARVEVRASTVACCAGAWSAGLVGSLDGDDPRIETRRTKGVHLVMPALSTRDGFVIASAEDRRIVFLIPWYGRTLLGTTDTDYAGDPDRVAVEREDVDYLLDRANRMRSGSPWTRDDVIAAFAGLRTLAEPAGHRAPSSVTREWKLVEPRPRLLVSLGGKYTSARADAARIVDRALAGLSRDPVPCPTRDLDLPWRPPGDLAAWEVEIVRRGLSVGLDEETIVSCARRYGRRVDGLLDAVRDDPTSAGRIVAGLPFCVAELHRAVDDEMARNLDDVLRRRVPLALLCRLPEDRQDAIARLVGRRVGWSEARTRREAVEFATRYAIPRVASGAV